jgi:hypothetical protein
MAPPTVSAARTRRPTSLLTKRRCSLCKRFVLPLNFSSILPVDRRDELEAMMFFNPQQGDHESSINASILSYGFPKIIQEEDYLRIGIEGKEVQTLYAFVLRGKLEELAGVIVYTRISPDTLVLLHMAVKPEYSYADGYKNELVLVRMLAQIRSIAKRIKGVKNLSIAYAGQILPKAELE